MPTVCGIIVVGIATTIFSLASHLLGLQTTVPLCLLSGPACLLLLAGCGAAELVAGTVAVYWGYWLAFALAPGAARLAWPLAGLHLAGAVVGWTIVGPQLPY